MIFRPFVFASTIILSTFLAQDVTGFVPAADRLLQHFSQSASSSTCLFNEWIETSISPIQTIGGKRRKKAISSDGKFEPFQPAGGSGVLADIEVTPILPPAKAVTKGKMMDAVDKSFPGAQTNKELVGNIKSALAKYGYGKSSLVATSLCADEVNRPLERDLGALFDDNFSMGGLAGFPFGGITAFGAMASHIPDGGSCLVVFGPHVGVDSTGKVGTVERRGRKNGGACCGSAVAASGYVAGVHSGTTAKYGPPEVPDDAQQNFVGTALLPYAEALEAASDKMTELPYALYDAQKKLMDTIVKAGAGSVAGDGKIAVLGGIQINLPPGKSDCFLPLSVEVYSNGGELIEDISDTINAGKKPTFDTVAADKKPAFA